MHIQERLSDVRDDAAEWCHGKSWLWRLPLLIYLAYAGVQHIRDPEYGSVFSAIIFGVHELGHVLFSVLGEFLSVAGGSLCQVAAPMATAAMFMRQRDYFGVSVAGAWLSFSLYNLATYVGDARTQDLPLVGLSDDPIHDWNYLLSHLGLLRFDTELAALIRLVAFLSLISSIVFGVWLCIKMASQKDS